jgi:succinoglycan biosynthesis protein ExoO
MLRPRTVLVFTRHTPFPWEDGPGAYLFDILHHLHERGFSVHVGCIAPPESIRERAVLALPPSFARVVRLHLPGAVRFGRHIVFAHGCWRLARQQLRRTKTLASTPPHSCALEPEETRPITPADRAFATQLFSTLRPVAAIANYAWLTPLFAAAPADLSFRRICLHPEIAWKRAAANAARTGSPPTITAETEAELLGRADAVAAPSAADIREHRQRLPHGDFILAPLAQRARPLPPCTTTRLLFVGSHTAANAEGLAWFLAEVWPQIRAAVPSAELDVCGSVAELVLARPAGTVFHGPVADLEPYYREAALVVAPLLRASGLCLKLVEAAARARAVVATRAPLEGAPFLAGTVAVADTAADFAAHAALLLATPVARLELAERALAAVRGRLDPENCYATLVAALGP